MNTAHKDDIDWFDMPEIYYRASRMFRALGNPKAFSTLKLLQHQKALSVEEICVKLKRKHPAVSTILRHLRDLDLVRYQRTGNKAVYSLKDKEGLEPMLRHAEEYVRRAMLPEDVEM